MTARANESLLFNWLSIGLGLISALLLVNAGIAYRNTRQLHNEGFWVAHTHEVLASLDDVLSTVKDAETGQRGFLITGKEDYLIRICRTRCNFSGYKDLCRDRLV